MLKIVNFETSYYLRNLLTTGTLFGVYFEGKWFKFMRFSLAFVR